MCWLIMIWILAMVLQENLLVLVLGTSKGFGCCEDPLPCRALFLEAEATDLLLDCNDLWSMSVPSLFYIRSYWFDSGSCAWGSTCSCHLLMPRLSCHWIVNLISTSESYKACPWLHATLVFTNQELLNARKPKRHVHACLTLPRILSIASLSRTL